MPPSLLLGILIVTWTYVVFPLVTLGRAALRPRPVQMGDACPPLSVVIAAHNEVVALADKLENVLGSDYDPDLLEVIVATDGCTDGTTDVVRRYADRGVTLVELPRVGKAGALNAAVARATGAVIVYSDANSMLAPSALRRLVRPFSDPDVGGVAGDQRYLTADDGPHTADGRLSGSGERSYWSFDRVIKVAESRAGNVISATGALYAVRRELVEEVRDGVTDDFWISTGVIAQGRRLVFEPTARVYEPVADDTKVEFGRKVRVITRGLRGVQGRRALLHPRHGYYAVQLASHKLLRRLMVFPLVMMYVESVVRCRQGPAYRAAAWGQTVVYGAGAVGALMERRASSPRVLALPAYFCFVNWACARAVWNVVTGRHIDRWEPQRRAVDLPRAREP